MSKKFPEFSHILVGKRVEVTSRGYYSADVLGQGGIVRAVYGADSIAVDLDFMANYGSKHGWFYFKAEELDVIISSTETTKAASTAEKGETNMYKITNYLNVAEVHFLNDDRAFHTIECANFEASLAEGDLCVVKTERHGVGLAEVTAIKARTDGDLTREIVARVDASAYEERVQTRKKAAEIKAKMQERAKQLQDIVLYQTLAKEDPSMAQLLQEFQSLPEY